MKNEPKNIELVPYDPKWAEQFENEARVIYPALGSNCLALHHFGSTSIPGLSAKPKIDILAVVHHLASIDGKALESIGFESRGEVIPTGRYFCKKTPRVHLHIFEKGNPLIQRNLNFRDWLRFNKHDRAAYEKLKQQLAATHTDEMSYCRAKTEFIAQIIEKAEEFLHSHFIKPFSISAYIICQTPEGPRYLIIRRCSQYLSGTWQMVSGKIESGETAIQAAVREIQEETGLAPTRFYCADFVETFYMQPYDRIALAPVFVAFVDRMDVQLSPSEHDAYEWLPFEEAQKRLSFSEQRKAIAQVHEHFVLQTPDDLHLVHLQNYKGTV